MKRPILAFGHGMLKQACIPVEPGYPGLDTLVSDMWETMENASGCGLAAPQIGLPVRLFVVDSRTTYQNLAPADRRTRFDTGDRGIRQTFINARITGRSEKVWFDNEGCLSIPGLSGQVERPWSITVEYHTEAFERRIGHFAGATARMIQHEFDHTEGILYLDHLSPLDKRRLEAKLKKIVNGQVRANYPIRFI